MLNDRIYICIKKYMNTDNYSFNKGDLYTIDYETPNRIYFHEKNYNLGKLNYGSFNKHIPKQIFYDYFLNYNTYIRKKKLKKIK